MEALLLPRSCRQPRSRRPTRAARRDASVVLHCCKDGSSSSKMASVVQNSYAASRYGENMSEVSLCHCSMSRSQRHEGDVLKLMEGPAVEIGSVAQDVLSNSCNDGCNGPDSNDQVNTHSAAGTITFNPCKSLVSSSGSFDAWLAPGNVVWAKTPYHEWWPAEIMDEKATPEWTSDLHVGRVLVHLYGSHKSDWLDPLEDLSQFNYCYEERSKNPCEEFQNALKQALTTKVHPNPSLLPVICTDEVKTSIKDHHTCDRLDISSSSSAKDCCLEEGRGKRNKKKKLHFDELTIPKKSMKGARRIRIMRYLALMPPVGSPFSRSHKRTD